MIKVLIEGMTENKGGKETTYLMYVNIWINYDTTLHLSLIITKLHMRKS